MELINLAAIVIIPILAVIIGQYLQDRSEKRKDKMRVFTHLMSYRSFFWLCRPIFCKHFQLSSYCFL